jgi:DNA polymerase III subunit beta
MNNSFIVEQKSLLTILASMQPICAKRTTLDATSTILFHVGHRELVLKSTDLEISLQSSYTLKESHITQPQSFLVQGKRIFELVKELDGDITFILEDAQLTLQAGSVHLSLNIKDTEEFPPFPERIENRMQLDTAFLLGMLNRVAFLIPQNNANTALNGLFLEINATEFKMTATDGHCLVQVCSTAYTLQEPCSWLLPRRAIFEVKKILENGVKDAPIFLGICSNQLVFSGDSFNFFTRLLSDTFPQYATILKKDSFVPAVLDRAHFVKTLRRSACLLSGQFIATQFKFNLDSLKVLMHNKDVGRLEEEVPLLDFAGDAVDIRFYAPYLLNGIQTFAEDTVHFYLQNGTKPIIFESQSDRYSVLYLVMPVAATNG